MGGVEPRADAQICGAHRTSVGNYDGGSDREQQCAGTDCDGDAVTEESQTAEVRSFRRMAMTMPSVTAR